MSFLLLSLSFFFFSFSLFSFLLLFSLFYYPKSLFFLFIFRLSFSLHSFDLNFFLLLLFFFLLRYLFTFFDLCFFLLKLLCSLIIVSNWSILNSINFLNSHTYNILKLVDLELISKFCTFIYLWENEGISLQLRAIFGSFLSITNPNTQVS